MVSVATALIAAVFAVASPAEPAAPNRPAPAARRNGYELLTAVDRHVRATSARAQELLAQGLRRSGSFAALMNALESTDLIVHIEITGKVPSAIAGRLMFATALDGGPRYVRIQIADHGTRSEQIAAIAHELQHAIEVGEAPEVRDLQSFDRLYKRIGVPGGLTTGYDTRAAQLAGQRVLLEIGR